jgi:hypothetical protein
MSIMSTHNQDDAKLAAEIGGALKSLDAAIAVTKEKQIVVGKLLAEAHKRHPTQKAFEEFLALAGDIHIRRAESLIAIALGRKGFEQHQKDNAAAQQRHRDKLKAEREEREKAKAEEKATPEPEHDYPWVREKFQEVVLKLGKQVALSILNKFGVKKVQDLLPADFEPVYEACEQALASRPAPAPPTALRNAQSPLYKFELACRHFLPRLDDAELKQARDFALSDKWREQDMEAA